MSLTSTTPGGGSTSGPEGVFFARVTPEERYAALSLLLTGHSHFGADPTVDNFVSFAADQALALDDLWVARDRARLLAAALIIPCAGRTAMLFVSPIPRSADPAVAAALVAAACRAQDGRQAGLVQALLDPGQEPVGHMLELAGFSSLAELIYMQRPIERSPIALDLPPGLHVEPWTGRNRALFASAILASYRDTLDCPGLLGLRHIDDILAGHMATGRFYPELWFALSEGEEPAGVMLLNVIPSRRALELVYLGLAPAARGRGLSRRLLRHGLSLGPRYSALSMLLAVDQANTPALNLYRDLSFVPTARKHALILPIRAESDAATQRRSDAGQD